MDYSNQVSISYAVATPALYQIHSWLLSLQMSGNLAAIFLEKKETKKSAYAVVMVSTLYRRFFCYNSVTQKYHHY